MLRIFALLVFLLPTFAYAQTYPVYGGVYVNDPPMKTRPSSASSWKPCSRIMALKPLC